MSEAAPTLSSRSRTLSWVHAIPLGTLGPSSNSTPTLPQAVQQNAAATTPEPKPHTGSSKSQEVDPERISLPSSRPSSPTAEPAQAGIGIATNAPRDPVRYRWYHSASSGSSLHLKNATGAQNSTPVATPENGQMPHAARPRTPGYFPEVTLSPVRTEAGSDETMQLRTTTDYTSRQPPDYWTRVSPLAEYLPHLRILPLDHEARYPAIGKVTCLDYPQGNVLPRIFKCWSFDRFSRGAPEWSLKVEALKTDVPADIATRMILVEDLSDQLMEALGSAFNLDPDIFAEHLNKAAHYRVDYDDEVTQPMMGSGASPCFASLKWIRPVKQKAKLSEWLDKPEMLLDEQETESKSRRKSKTGRGVSWVEEGTETLHLVTPDNNIFRQCWGLSSNSSKAATRLSRKDLLTDLSAVDWTCSTIPTAWEERATLFTFEEGPVTFVILLLDPLPSLTDRTRSAAKRSRYGPGRPTVSCEQDKVDCFLPLAPRTRLRQPTTKLDATTQELSNLRASVQTVTPAMDAIQQWTLDTDSSTRDPILALFKIVRADTKAFVHTLEATLEQIGKDSLDDYLMERRLADWRRLMNDFQTELPAINNSLRSFIGFLSHRQGLGTSDAAQAIIAELEADLSSLKTRIDETYAALRVDMQFSESRRSITEAKTVTKLTELAFIFIPLSFVSSLFSMSVNELENGVPIWTFALTALVFAMVAYGVRFLVANDFLADSSRRAVERFWARRNVRRGTSIPTLTFVLLTAQEIWGHGGQTVLLTGLGLAFMSAFIVVPVGFLWSSTGLDAGFKVSLTLLLVLSGLGAAIFQSMMGGVSGYGTALIRHLDRVEGSDTSSQSGGDV